MMLSALQPSKKDLSSHNSSISAPIPVPTSDSSFSDNDSGYSGSPPSPQTSPLPLIRSKNFAQIKPSDLGEIAFFKADGSRQLSDLEFIAIRKKKIVVLMGSMAGRTFEPGVKNQLRDNFFPDRFAGYYNAAKEKNLPVVIGLAEQWLNIVRAYVPVGSDNEAILRDCFDKDANFSGRLNRLKKDIYLEEITRRKIDTFSIVNAESTEAQTKLFEELVNSADWQKFAQEMLDIGIKVPTEVTRIEEPEPDFSWKGFINQIDPGLLGNTDLTATHPALTQKITPENLTKLIELLQKNTSLTEQWLYFLLTLFSEDLNTIKALNYEWYNSWEGTVTSNAEKKLGMKQRLTPIVQSLTNGQALYAGYLVNMSIQYQRLDWFAYRHKFEQPLPITAFGPDHDWESATQLPIYKTEYEKYCASSMSTGAAGILDNSVKRAFNNTVTSSGYDSTPEYLNNFEKALNNSIQEQLLRARCKLLTRLHQIRETVMVLTLPHLMPYVESSDISQGKRRPVIFYPHKEPDGWAGEGMTIYNHHLHMDQWEQFNPPKIPPLVQRAEFGVIKTKTTKSEEAKKPAENLLMPKEKLGQPVKTYSGDKKGSKKRNFNSQGQSESVEHAQPTGQLLSPPKEPPLFPRRETNAVDPTQSLEHGIPTLSAQSVPGQTNAFTPLATFAGAIGMPQDSNVQLDQRQLLLSILLQMQQQTSQLQHMIITGQISPNALQPNVTAPQQQMPQVMPAYYPVAYVLPIGYPVLPILQANVQNPPGHIPPINSPQLAPVQVSPSHGMQPAPAIYGGLYQFHFPE